MLEIHHIGKVKGLGKRILLYEVYIPKKDNPITLLIMIVKKHRKNARKTIKQVISYYWREPNFTTWDLKSEINGTVPYTQHDIVIETIKKTQKIIKNNLTVEDLRMIRND